MKKLFSLLLILLVFTSFNYAQDYAAALKLSTLGVGVEALRSFGPQFNARLGISYFAYNADGSTDDYSYNAKANLFSVSALADYFPFQSMFRITGGIIINLNKGNIDMIPAKTTVIGGDSYTPDKLGKLKADIDFNKFAPYIGLGFGNPTAGNEGLKFTFDIGTAYQGPANVDLSAKGLLEPSAAPDQEERLESNLSWFKWYPVISLGLVYKF